MNVAEIAKLLKDERELCAKLIEDYAANVERLIKKEPAPVDVLSRRLEVTLALKIVAAAVRSDGKHIDARAAKIAAEQKP